MIPPHRVLQIPGYAYPDFSPKPAWWDELWGRFEACAPYNKYVNVEKLKDKLWPEYRDVFPKTFRMILQYEYGLEEGAIDVVPGMRLRVDSAMYQYRQEPAVNVASGTIYLHVNRQHGFLSFDPFLGYLNEEFETVLGLKKQHFKGYTWLASGLTELHAGTDRKQKFYRLLYPTETWREDEPGQPKEANSLVLLVGAASREVLSAASLRKFICINRKIGDLTNPTQSISDKYRLLGFGGRTMVVPEVQIGDGDHYSYQAVGTTLLQIVDLRWNSMRDGEEATRGVYDGLDNKVRLYRRFKGTLYPVLLDCCKDRAALYDLPLLKGDQVRWQH